eukprot:Em0012g457a
MEKFLAPEPITGEGDLNEQWRRFKREFLIFLTATEKGAASEQIKLALFLRLVGQRINDVYETMQFVDGEDRTSWSVVVGKLDGLCAPRTSKHVMWDKFLPTETGRKKSRSVYDADSGVDNDRMRRRLLETEKLDLAKAIQMCQVMETTLADLQHMSKKPEAGEEEGPVASVRTRKGFRGKENDVQKEGDGAKNPAAGQQGRRTGERKGCSRCGMVHPPRQCPAFGKQCLKCQKYNHFAKVCRGSDKPTNLVEEAEMDFDSEEERTRSRAEDVFQIQLLSFETESICVAEACQHLSKERILRDYADVFEGLGSLPGEYDIEVDTTVSPVQNRPRKIPYKLRSATETKLREMEKAGIIKKVEEPTDWISSMTVVWKADKRQIRICLDPRNLNKAIKRNHFNMPTIDDVLPRLDGAKVFSILDAKDGFLHIHLTEKSSYLTTFWGPNGRYRWCRLPFGLSSAPEEFQRRLQNALHGIEGVAVVADDILVFGVGTTMEDAIQNHDEALLRVLKRAPPLQFEAEQTKAATSLARIVIHRTQDFGVRCAPGPSQNNGYQPDASSHLSTGISEPLRALTESNKDFVWGKVEQEHFEQIKALIKTDHKPLEVITKKSILAAPRRLQRMLLQLQRYDLEIIYRPGKQQWIADILSRLPVESPCTENFCRQEIFHTKHGELEAQEFSTVDETDYVHVKDEKIEEVRQAAKVDEEQKLLRQVIVDGWPPSIREVPIGIRCYWNFRDTLTVSDGVIYKGDQIAVPTSLRETYLGKLHASHMGKESTLRRAKDAVYWPNMAKDIEGMISKCRICEEDSPAQSKEKLQAHSLSQQPWGKVGTDLFEYKGQDYLVMVDYLSDFFEVSELAQVSAGAVIRVVKEQFARHGVPVIVQSDGGPQFVSREFSDFATEWGFTHTVSSPYHSSSNGKAESAVKITKRLFRRSLDRFLALLEWRNTPTVSINLSPCQRLFSRRTRGLVPVTPEKLQPATEQQAWKLKLQRQNIIQTQAESKGRNLRPLQVGKPVLVQDLRARKMTWVRGVCEKQLSDRSYLVRVEDRLLRRNRRFLKPLVHSPDRNAEEMSVEIVPSDVSIPNQMGQSVSQEEPPWGSKDQQVVSSGSANTLTPESLEGRGKESADLPEVVRGTETESVASPEQRPYITRSGRAVNPPARYRDMGK